MESNDQLTNTDESENHSGQTEMTEQSTIEPEVKTEIIKEIKTEVVPVEVNIYYYVVFIELNYSHIRYSIFIYL